MRKHNNSLPNEDQCMSFLGLVKPRSAYSDIELEVSTVAKMTVGIMAGNHCIVYKQSKPNDMGGVTTLCDNILASSPVYATPYLIC